MAGMRNLAAIAIIVALTSAASAGSPGGCTFDRETVGVTPCGADRPNVALSGRRPPGEPVSWSQSCSVVTINAQFPGRAAAPTKALICAD